MTLMMVSEDDEYDDVCEWFESNLHNITSTVEQDNLHVDVCGIQNHMEQPHEAITWSNDNDIANLMAVYDNICEIWR